MKYRQLLILLFASLQLSFAQGSDQKEGNMDSTSPTKGHPIPLWEGMPRGMKVDDGFRPTLTPQLLDAEKPLGAVVVVPGGGYQGRAEHEKWPIADHFNRAGLHAFVLDYRVSPHRDPEPLLDVSRAVRMIRANADAWKVKPDKIAVLGFSAGGHLTGSLGVFFDRGDATAGDPIDHQSSRPDAIVLCYAVISSKGHGHQGSFRHLLGENASEADLQRMSLEDQVTQDTPPTFLWHTADDPVVPVENSLLFASALSAHKVPFELHVYPSGHHGMGIASGEDAHVGTWGALCVEWLKGMGW